MFVKALIFRQTILACDVLSMVDQITFQTISIMIAATTVIIGVINSIISSRREEKQRQEQLIFQRFQGYNLDYFRAYHHVALQTDWKTPEEYMEKYSRYGDLEAAARATCLQFLG